MISFTGQAAIITGAGAGIGRATAIALARRGANILVNDPNPDGRAHALCHEIGSGAVANTVPVGSHDSARAIASAALAAFGRIDILINNAGIACPRPFGEGDDAEIDHLLAVNLLGAYALMRAVWPTMKAQGYGRILNTSSSASFGSGISGPYAAAKAGLIGLTKDAAIAAEPFGVRVNAIMPSASTSLLDKHPDPAFRAWMEANMPPESVAAAVLWLVSRDAQINGEIFAAGGGRMSRIAFMESVGVRAATPTPEYYLAQTQAICDMTGANVISKQADHQANTARVMPGHPH